MWQIMHLLTTACIYVIIKLTVVNLDPTYNGECSESKITRSRKDLYMYACVCARAKVN